MLFSRSRKNRMLEYQIMKKFAWAAFAIFALSIAAVQFVPGPALLIPAELPTQLRSEHRLLNFEGIDNFRDLGGYPTIEGRHVKWGVLYRSGNLANASRADLQGLNRLQLSTLIDFRSTLEKKEEPNILPQSATFEVVEIPTLDGGDLTVAHDIMQRIEDGNFDDFNPDAVMIEANRAFATLFTPQYSQFLRSVVDAQGKPVMWHCTAGKDRTGFAAAFLLRILGVDQDTIMADYMASKAHSLAAHKSDLVMLRLFKGDEAADKLAIIMGVEEHWLEAAFDAIDERWGSFDTYISDGLGLSQAEIDQLRDNLLTKS
jgi:protein-tyrosine phosphatase